MRILDSAISKNDLMNCDIVFDGPMIKAVVDIKKQIIGIDARAKIQEVVAKWIK